MSAACDCRDNHGHPDTLNFLTVNSLVGAVRLSVYAGGDEAATLLLDPSAGDAIAGMLITESARARKRQAEREGAPDGRCGSGDGSLGQLGACGQPVPGVLVSSMEVLAPSSAAAADEPVLHGARP